MLREDNSGFVHFPFTSQTIERIENGRTYVYIVAFDVQDISNDAYELSNLRIIKPTDIVSDDITLRTKSDSKISIDELIQNNQKNQEFESMYFPNSKYKNDFKSLISIPITSCICIGWSEYTYQIKEELGFWTASFRDLSNEGMRLYYSIKKLHNNKEVRILTFNTI